jgi:hypothetical protein
MQYCIKVKTKYKTYWKEVRRHIALGRYKKGEHVKVGNNTFHIKVLPYPQFDEGNNENNNVLNCDDNILAR